MDEWFPWVNHGEIRKMDMDYAGGMITDLKCNVTNRSQLPEHEFWGIAIGSLIIQRQS
jgi:hypothetical protein